MCCLPAQHKCRSVRWILGVTKGACLNVTSLCKSVAESRGWSPRSVTLGLFLGLSACSPSSDRAFAPMVVDSAGIQVVTYELAGAAIPTYRAVAEHDVEIGAVEGEDEYLLSRVVDVKGGADGSIMVSTGGVLRIYSTAGVHLQTLGRTGEGPGEFASPPTLAGLAGDTVYAWDGRTRRITSLLRSGELLETTPVGASATGPFKIMRQADGSFLFQSRWIARDANDPVAHDARVEVDSMVVELLSRTGTLLDTIGIALDRERVKARQALPEGRFGLMMADRPLTARAFARSDGRRLILGHSASFQLKSYTASGTVESIMRVHGAWPDIAPSTIRARLEEQLQEAAGEREIDPRTQRLYEEFALDRAPRFSEILIATNGDRWVASFEFDDSDGFEWLVFSPGGDLRGRVSTPPGLRVFEIGDGHLLGLVLDEFDVPFVRRHPFS